MGYLETAIAYLDHLNYQKSSLIVGEIRNNEINEITPRLSPWREEVAALSPERRARWASRVLARLAPFGAEPDEAGVEAAGPTALSDLKHDEAAEASWPPRPAELATWPVERRERWGRRAADLESEGVPWPESERRAFAEEAGTV